MKLQQGQVWKKADEYFRIVHLERLEVKYKRMNDPVSRTGTHHHVTKKDFCRLLKNAVLLPAAEARDLSEPGTAPAAPEPSADV